MRDADDPLQSQVVEAVADELARAFGREALAPRAITQPIADFHFAVPGMYLSANQPTKSPVSRRVARQVPRPG